MSSYTIDHKYRSRYASTKTTGSSNIAILLGVFNKTIIPRALVGYGYPTRARGIIVNYTTKELHYANFLLEIKVDESIFNNYSTSARWISGADPEKSERGGRKNFRRQRNLAPCPQHNPGADQKKSRPWGRDSLTAEVCKISGVCMRSSLTGRNHIVLCSWARHLTHTVPLST